MGTSSERGLQLLEKALLNVDIFAASLGVFAESLALIVTDRFWHHDLDLNEQITPTTASEFGHTFVSEPERLAALGPLGKVHLDSPIHTFHLDRVAEDSLWERDCLVNVKISTVPVEPVINAHVYLDQQISFGTAIFARGALALHPESLSGLNPGWDIDAQRRPLSGDTLAATVRTLLAEQFALAFTLWTG
jgi:hypothetical protein